MWRNLLILILLMMVMGLQNPLQAYQIPSSDETMDVVSLPQQASIQWEDLGLCDVMSASSTSIAAPSASSRVAHRSHSGNHSSRAPHSVIDDSFLSVSCCVLRGYHSASLFLPTRSADYYIYHLSRLRC